MEEKELVQVVLGEKVVNPKFKCSKCHQTISLKDVRQVCHRGRCKWYHKTDDGQCQPVSKVALEIEYS